MDVKVYLEKAKKEKKEMKNVPAIQVVEKWADRFKEAKAYAMKLIEEYGEPQIKRTSFLSWRGSSARPFKEITIKRERIPHKFPKLHYDFVYATKAYSEIPEDIDLGDVSSSIRVNKRDKEITTRCGSLVKNAATFGFIEDVIAGKIKEENFKSEYSKRILTNIIPNWYRRWDRLKERPKKGIER